MTKRRNPTQNKCNAQKTDGSGDKCSRAAGYGTDHLGWGRCKFHGGATPAGKIYAAKVEAADRILGFPIEIEPAEAILQQVRQSAGHVQWYHQQILRFDDVTGGDAKQVLLQLSEQGWDRSAWVRLYNEERDRLTRFAKLALDAGVAERQVKLAESQGELVAVALRGILKDLGLTPDQEMRAPEIVTRHLRAVS